ncbi:M48 family metallopeptidase [Estrella lausannensis]|uniref:Putative membrane protein n=1 Tax=Estrella lausannensis TaxID=483423 RepID=A0A0H5DR55_9BACT|nr:M48 family metallopeptidase [Estrella lausannensis]CRX39156.1 putative membrane protein [Estrella lausannensis]
MFSSLFYLFLALTLLTLWPAGLGEPLLSNAPSNLIGALLVFPLIPAGVLLILLLLKSKKKMRPLFSHFYQIALLLSLCISLEMGAENSLQAHISPELVPLALSVIFMTLYLTALFIFHYATYYPRTLYPESLVTSATEFSTREIRTIIPFVFPYFFLLLLITFLPELPPLWSSLILLAALILFVLFFPIVVVALWRMEPIEDPQLVRQMESICLHAKFRYRALGTWTVMDHSLTAAILGILPKFRYILFTRRLLRELPSSQVMAVLAHEIGHAKRGHLYKIPFVLLGMPLIAYLILLKVDPWLRLHTEESADLLIFVLLLFSLSLYFRFLFGFYLRMFEREADLFSLEAAGDSRALIEALDTIGILSGGTHDKPSWHHYSIRQRMDFLAKVNDNAALIDKHQRKVRICLAAYALFLFLLTAALWI